MFLGSIQDLGLTLRIKIGGFFQLVIKFFKLRAFGFI